MTDTSHLLAILWGTAGGAVLGLAFFQGLRITLERLGSVARPGTWMVLSMLLRFGLVMGGLFLLARLGDPWLLLSAAGGFALARTALVRRALGRNRPGVPS